MSEADDTREQIARLEAQIDALAETVEGCRKIILAAKLAIVIGVLLILAMLVGAIRTDLAALSGATAAVLGGIVLRGSNRSTSDQALAKIKQAEAARTALIDRLEMRRINGD